MKKSLAILLLMLAANASFAQAKKTTAKRAGARNAAFKNPPAARISLGFTSGIGTSRISILPANSGGKLSYDLGVSAMYSRSAHWGFGAQLIASHEGYRFRDTGTDVINYVSVNPIYARLPLQVTYFFGRRGNRFRPKIYLGPSFAFKVDELYLNNGDGWRLSREQFKTYDAGINSGVGLNVYEGGRTWLAVDLGYYHGLTPALDAAASGTNNFNRCLRLNVGLMWGL